MPKSIKTCLGLNTCYRYTRFADTVTYTLDFGQTELDSNSLSLSQVRSYTDFTALYDKFKINGVFSWSTTLMLTIS